MKIEVRIETPCEALRELNNLMGALNEALDKVKP